MQSYRFHSIKVLITYMGSQTMTLKIKKKRFYNNFTYFILKNLKPTYAMNFLIIDASILKKLCRSSANDSSIRRSLEIVGRKSSLFPIDHYYIGIGLFNDLYLLVLIYFRNQWRKTWFTPASKASLILVTVEENCSELYPWITTLRSLVGL